MDGVVVLSGLMVAIGLVGILVAVLPGLLLVWAGVALWCVERGDTRGWLVLAVATVLTVAGSAVKYLWPGRRLRESGVPWTTLALAGLLGIVGFFVIPVVGLFLGFVLGVYLAEGLRHRHLGRAWPSTRRALAAVGWSIVIELLTGLLVTGTWIAAVVTA
jgi:uncharacterized protein YqgC (DUF456 family)